MGLFIRQAGNRDISALAHLMDELGYPTSIDCMALRYERIKANDCYQTMVAEIDGCVVGMIGMFLGQHYEKDDHYIRIVALVVDADYRKHGIGSALLQEAEKWANNKSASAVTLNSGNRPERENAHDFYCRHGYRDKSIGFSKALCTY